MTDWSRLGRVLHRMRELLETIAEESIDEPSRMRMFILALAAANWVTLMMLLLIVADLEAAKPAATLAVAISCVVFGAYLILSRLPAVAQLLLRAERVIHG